MPSQSHPPQPGAKPTWLVVVLFALFVGEFAGAQAIGSVALFADSIGQLSVALAAFLAFIASTWSAPSRAQAAYACLATMLVPVVATLGMAWTSIATPVPPAWLPLALAASGAAAIQFGCAGAISSHLKCRPSAAMRPPQSAWERGFPALIVLFTAFETAISRSVIPDIDFGVALGAVHFYAMADVWKAAAIQSDDI